VAKLSKLTGFLDRLDGSNIHYTLSSVTEGTISVGVTVPGERWEVEFDGNGEVEVEVFKSDGEVSGLSATDGLFKRRASD